jgi:hypothetical protein
MKKIYCLLVVFCTLLILSGISYSDESKVVKEFNDVRSVKPGEFTEKCLTLRPKQVFNYKFEATNPVYFNIHYHGKEGKEYFVKKKEISSYEDSLTEFQYKKAYKNMSKKASLCMLWRNNTDEPVDITIDCTVTAK